jgi:hypothetical protein
MIVNTNMMRLKHIIDSHKRELSKINNQRMAWLKLSSVIFVITITLIFSWDLLENKNIWWFIVSSMLIVTINWWYWTMKTITILLNHQQEENVIIKELIDELREIKKTIKEIDN